MDLPSGSNTVVTEPTSKYFGRKTKLFGVEFRSQLEAQWAAFFTLSGIRWGYEMHKVNTTHGGYIPDFYLPDIQGGLICEVKPLGRAGEDYKVTVEKLRCAVTALKKNATVLRGSPEQFCTFDICEDGFITEDGIGGSHEVIFWGEQGLGWDNQYCFCACPHCWRVGYEYDGRGDRVCKDKGKCDTSVGMALDATIEPFSHGDKGYSANHPRIQHAAKLARLMVQNGAR